MKPSATSFPAYYKKYIDLIKEEELSTAFEQQFISISNFLMSITEEKSLFAYAPGKWTIRELLQHITDAERVFAYRAMCFARKEQQSLPGFDEDDYARNSFANERSWKNIVEEFISVRKCTELLFSGFSAETLNNTGIANDNPISINSIGFCILGHYAHHVSVIKEKYL